MENQEGGKRKTNCSEKGGKELKAVGSEKDIKAQAGQKNRQNEAKRQSLIKGKDQEKQAGREKSLDLTFAD